MLIGIAAIAPVSLASGPIATVRRSAMTGSYLTFATRRLAAAVVITMFVSAITS
jgi:hypothetical protein